MTEKTPIEKAAEELYEFQLRVGQSVHHTEIADIIRRRLEKEMPENHGICKAPEQVAFIDGHNQCRRAIGLRDEEETT